MFGEDIASKIMQHLARSLKQETFVFQESNILRFKETYGHIWDTIMFRIDPLVVIRKDRGRNRPLYDHYYMVYNFINSSLGPSRIMGRSMDILNTVDNIVSETATPKDYPLRKGSKKKSPVMDKRGKKARSNYLKRESRLRMKMIAKR